MSTGSVASDADDCEACRRRTSAVVSASGDRTRRRSSGTCYHSLCSDEEPEEVDDDGKGSGREERRRSRSHPKDARQSQRNAANARERARMRVLSKAFSRLKTSLPWVPVDTKLSKLDTLRLASSYISHLRQLLQDDRYENGFVHPVNLTWPFVTSGRTDDGQDVPAAASRRCGATA